MNTLTSRRRIQFAATFALAVMAAPAIAADVTFAQFDQFDGATQQWSITTSKGTTTVSPSGSTEFTFSGVGVPFSGPQLATLALTASSTQIGSCGVACGAGDSFDQFGYSGTFSFTEAAGPYAGDILLQGIFEVTGSPSTTGAQFNANVGSSSGGFDASATAGNLNQLVLSSAFVDFIGQTEEDASFKSLFAISWLRDGSSD
jgi:hypothetical protein